MSIESLNRVINLGRQEESCSNLIWGSNPVLNDAIDTITKMTKSLVKKTGPRAPTLTQYLQNPNQENYDVQQQKKDQQKYKRNERKTAPASCMSVNNCREIYTFHI